MVVLRVTRDYHVAILADRFHHVVGDLIQMVASFELFDVGRVRH